ncbi:MAG: S41 family peptidase [Parvularculaceae bacterium]
MSISLSFPGFAAVGAAALLALSGCSGGSAPAPAPARVPTPAPPSGGGTTTPPAPSGPVFTRNSFDPASTYKDRCQAVRTGVDIEGNPYTDLPGSLIEELFWLRSWTHETYLWNDEVVDQDPHNFNDRLQYFDVLKTTATTASGRDKDEFHFTQPTDEYLADINSAPTASYGFRLIANQTTPPRDFKVVYTEPGSPAAQVVSGLQNFTRGATLLAIDGVDLVNANTQAEIDILNAGLFPATAGESHMFTVQDAGAASPRDVTVVSADIAPTAVNRTAIINTATGDVGYILLNTFGTFSSEKEIFDAITAMSTAGVSDLVIDLRYNGGGLLAVASQLDYMIAGAGQTNGRIFEQLRFNALAGSIDPVTGQPNDPVPFFSTGLGFSVTNGTPLPTLNLNRVFVLSTDRTCSASESVINSLRGINVNVILIGTTTCGKPFGFYPTDNCGVTYFTVQFQGTNDQGFGDYADGFGPANSSNAFSVKAPGCAVADDLTHNLGDPSEDLLAAALQYRDTSTCPAPPPMSVSAPGAGEQPALSLDVAPYNNLMMNNRDMRLPKGSLN